MARRARQGDPLGIEEPGVGLERVRERHREAIGGHPM